MIACAQQDNRPRLRDPSTSPAKITITLPATDSGPATVSGSTTRQGVPTEAALLQWVRRLSPESFAAVPKEVRSELLSRRCEIPQAGSDRSNAISGAFTKRGAVEWAVLCSVHDTSQILIINAADGSVVDSLNKSGDAKWIQGNGGDTWLYSRMISLVPVSRLSAVPPDTTAADILYYGAWLPKPIDHDGIDEAFLDKASTTFYSSRGRWFSVVSSD
jgi:hypothetical protein